MKIVLLCLKGILLVTIFISCSGGEKIVRGNLYKLSDRIDFSQGKFAIFPFKSASEGKTLTNRVSTDGNAIADILTIEMLYKGYKVLEREKLGLVLNESALSQSGIADSEDKISEIGKVLGADFLIYGSVIQYENIAEAGEWYISIGVSARIIHVKSGRVLMVCTASSQGNNISEALGGISMAITDALKEDKIYVWQ